MQNVIRHFRTPVYFDDVILLYENFRQVVEVWDKTQMDYKIKYDTFELFLCADGAIMRKKIKQMLQCSIPERVHSTTLCSSWYQNKC